MVLRIQLGGKIGISVDGVTVAPQGLGRLGPPVLAYLVAERQRPVSRDELAELLWGDTTPSSYEQMVRGVIATLRRLLRDAGLPATEILTTELGGYQLHLPPSTVVDVETVAAGLASAGALLAAGNAEAALDAAESAVAVASRQFLPGVSGAWVERRQAEMRERHVEALEAVSVAAAAGARWARAVGAAEDAIALEPYRESAYLRLIAAHAGAGNRGEALRAYERCRRHLANELGVRPSPSTEALYLTLLQDEPATTEAAAAVALPRILGGRAGTVLSGRDAEVVQLTEALRRAQVDGRQVFLIAGEPGIGKTAVVGAFARAAWLDGAHVLYGRCDEDLSVPYQPCSEALDAYLAECPLVELQAHVAGHGGELSRLTPTLARRLPEMPRAPSTDPEADRYRLFEAVGALLTSAASVRPVVLILDDLQWAANETLLLLRHLIRAGQPAARLLVVAIYRHTEVGSSHPLGAMLADLRREAIAVERLMLDGLDEAGVAAIVDKADSGLGGNDRLGLVRAVHAHTAGNPFFAGELVRHLIETGALYRRAGAWTYYNHKEVDIPQGVRDVVSRRLQRLSGSSNRALLLASVVGGEFTLDLLERMVGPPQATDMLDAIEEAVVGHLVVEMDQGRYRFSHDLVRDTIYLGLSTTRRCRFHRQVAEALETSAQGPSGPLLAALAHHFAEAASASCAAKAAEYALAAAREDIALAAWHEAITRLERGLEALELQDRPDLKRRCDLLLLLAETWMRFFDPERVLEVAARAVETARELRSPDRFGRAAYWALRASSPSSSASSVAVATEALDVVGHTDAGLRAKLLALLAHFRQDDERASTANEALVLARSSEDSDALGAALMVAADSLRGSPSAREYLALADEMVTGAPADGWDGWRNGRFYRGLGRLALGDRSGFEEDLAACGRLGTERRFWHFPWVAAMWDAALALLDGRFAEVEPLAAVARGIAPRWEEYYLRQLFRLHVERGEPVAALDVATALDARNQIHRSMLLFALSEQDGVEAHRRELEAFVDEALGLRPVPPEHVPVTLSYRAEVAATLGGSERVTRLYEEFRPYGGQVVIGGMGEACMGAVDRYLGVLAASAGRRTVAESHFRAALALEAGMRSRPLVARTKHRYGQMLLEGGRAADRARARKLLTSALDTADTLGMVAVAAGSRRLLDHAYTASTPGS